MRKNNLEDMEREMIMMQQRVDYQRTGRDGETDDRSKERSCVGCDPEEDGAVVRRSTTRHPSATRGSARQRCNPDDCSAGRNRRFKPLPPVFSGE